MKNSVTGFPRIGKNRELKFITEKYFKKEISFDELYEGAKNIRLEHIKLQKEKGIDFIPSNDFSFYDNMLDMAQLLNAIPERFRKSLSTDHEIYFAMARGHQDNNTDLKALSMKKWFNTNYHYIVPEIEDSADIRLTGTKPFDEYTEAKDAGFDTKPVIIGPFTFLKLCKFSGDKNIGDFKDKFLQAYAGILDKFNSLEAEWIQIDEPCLVRDLDSDDISFFISLYEELLGHKGNLKILLQTYFGDIRDCYTEVISLNLDGIGLDLIEGKENLNLIKDHEFPKDKTLFAGVVNGKNIWKNNYGETLETIGRLKQLSCEIVLSTSCSLLHSPFTIENETEIRNDVLRYFAFATEKLNELKELSSLGDALDYQGDSAFKANTGDTDGKKAFEDMDVQNAVSSLSEKDFTRLPVRSKRVNIQKEALCLPPLPTTTIGSFPQTAEVKRNRSEYKKGIIDKETYDKNIFEFIKECIDEQLELDLDVLVHGEFERNDMVEFFGECLEGFIFTKNAWVQSYGTRCVKPPIIFGDIRRRENMTVKYIKHAQSLTDKPVKGMLTGPVTILNWSFPREDISRREIAMQIALAIKEEVTDLEEAGIKVIQIDEAALREKLPLRKADRYSEYLDWAIPAFRLCHSGVRPETQIHTHMCYSEFGDIIKDIDNMDADVISFEASRSTLSILDDLKEAGFETQVGPGVYDIHSPRVPGTDEIADSIKKIIEKIKPEQVWVNPDCGLKTRGTEETYKSLKNLTNAAKSVREAL